MNKKNRGILIGMILGDGYLYVRKDKNYPNTWVQNLSVLHGQNQRDYIEHKAQKIHSIIGGKAPNVRKIKNNGYIGYRFDKSNSYFRVLHRWIYKNNVKTYTRKVLDMLTPEGIAYWYMDDGSLYPKKRKGKIHAYELVLSTYVSKEQNQIIIDYFCEVHNLKFGLSKSKGKYRLRMGTKEARKFIELVDPYIIKSMKYKTNIS